MNSAGELERRLSRVSRDGIFEILAIDHVGALAATMRPENPGAVTDFEMYELKRSIVAAMAEHASGVLLDPEAGLLLGPEKIQLPADTGLVIGIEHGDYADVVASPRLLPEWSVERAAGLGADAVKVSFYFEPGSASTVPEDFLRRVISESERLRVPLFAEPLVRPGSHGSRRDAVLEGVRRIGALEPTVLKIEFPEDVRANTDRDCWAEACQEVSKLSPVAWTLLSAGQDHETFVELVEIAVAQGASGFLAGRTVWGDIVTGERTLSVGSDRLVDLSAAARRPHSR